MRHFSFFITVVILISCGRPNSGQGTFDSILETGSKQTELHNVLAGTWEGYYECLEFSSDTVFYESYEETLGFMLTNTVTDSSLIKEVKFNKDTIKRRITLTFNIEDAFSENNSVTVETNMTKKTFPFSTRFSILEYNTTEKSIHFGDERNQKKFMYVSEDGEMISNVLNDSLSWNNVDLIIESVDETSAVFNFQTGIGQLVIKKIANRR